MNSSEKRSKKERIIIYRGIICVAGWVALFLICLGKMLEDTYNGDAFVTFGNLFSTYTIQSNLLVAIWLTIALVYRNKDDKPLILESKIHGAITLYITVTFLVFALFLASSHNPTGLFILTNLLVHYVIPIAFIIEWILTETNVKYKWSFLLYWITYPLFYIIYTIIRGYITGFYPYSFIDLNQISFVQMIITTILLASLFLLLGSLYIFLNRRIYNVKMSGKDEKKY